MYHRYDEADYFAAETARLQSEWPHVFHRKLPRRKQAQDHRPTFDAHEIGVEMFAAVHAAAEFALAFGLSLDVMVTLDLARMGAETGEAAQKEVTRFLKNYNAWASAKFCLAAWIYAIECSPKAGSMGYHAHIALFIHTHVQGPDSSIIPAPIRREFKDWARGYTQRQFGRHIPRAIRVTGASKASIFRHWMAVTYLLKGYDRQAVAQSARRFVDQRPTYLGDLIPWPYCNPGPVDVARRIRISHSLGPKRRAIGVPTGLDHLLPTRPNWDTFRVDGHGELTKEQMDAIQWTVPIPKPFMSAWDDGIRDVRYLYPEKFYEYVTRQKPFEVEVQWQTDDFHSTLTEQLRAIDEAEEAGGRYSHW